MRGRLCALAVVAGAIAAATVGGATLTASGAGSAQNYLVVFNGSKVPPGAAQSVEQAGGTVVYSYDEIGVVVASSASPSFAVSLSKDAAVAGAASTAGLATSLDDAGPAAPPDRPDSPPSPPATDSDPLSGLQWDMAQIHTPEAHAITGGSPDVLVGDIDTGLDYTHPDLAANVDDADSVNCTSGAPVPGKVAAMDDHGHGTSTAGTIAAAANGIGIVGVAPNVRIAGIKAGTADGYFFPEAVVCAFMWAGSHGFDVTNNSYSVDPYLFNCRKDPAQRAVWEAVRRAVAFAQRNDVTVVASIGNRFEDLSHPTRDKASPTNGTPGDRPVNRDCLVLPAQLPGVIGVGADGNAGQTDAHGRPGGYLKAFYSNFGIGTVDLVAPGGDPVFGLTAAAPNGRVLSTWPASTLATTCGPPPARVVDPSGATYCYQLGTSAAAPHVTGVAALIVGMFGKEGPRGVGLKPNRVADILRKSADEQPCPASLPTGYTTFVGADDGKAQACEGGPKHNSWSGDGQVNALAAVTEGRR